MSSAPPAPVQGMASSPFFWPVGPRLRRAVAAVPLCEDADETERGAQDHIGAMTLHCRVRASGGSHATRTTMKGTT
ncbi:hypothetical protein [Rathayibacter toxicus]|nr:hypothetical protein [Rathayibacter toxicus]ALS58085.1 hypothetical protein APU90_10170 [Rathayibacter toxicus]PPH60222.1 hypothetical protein C5C93_06760 [Rathayibacter toxicus]PPH63728.1 hypothetical protein C5D13_06810 [Rathayibacter toxicus]PPH82176.1 hypothetical protein C5D20_06760 [Rathayibacter toxicus]PPH87679.1 hypothetical protein C5D31_06760 [Rathayibacter toxicus]